MSDEQNKEPDAITISTLDQYQTRVWITGNSSEAADLSAAIVKANAIERRASSPMLAVLLSIAAYECVECIVDLLENAARLNPHTGRVVHLNAELRLVPAEVVMLRHIPYQAAQLGAYINTEHVHVQSKGPGILLAHLSNFDFAVREARVSSFTHFATIAADMLFMKPGYADYIVNFDGTDEGHCANFGKPDMRPKNAVEDQHLLAQLKRIGRSTAFSVLHNRSDSSGCLSYGMIDGMFWHRDVFSTLRMAAPFSSSTQFASDAYYPSNLLKPLLNRTCKGIGTARARDLPPPSHTRDFVGKGSIARWSTYLRHLTYADVSWCLEAPAPDCFVLKGFHGKNDTLRRFVYNRTRQYIVPESKI